MTTTIQEGKTMIAKLYRGNSYGGLVIAIPKIIIQNCDLNAKSYVTIHSDSSGLITIQKLDLEKSK